MEQFPSPSDDKSNSCQTLQSILQNNKNGYQQPPLVQQAIDVLLKKYSHILRPHHFIVVNIPHLLLPPKPDDYAHICFIRTLREQMSNIGIHPSVIRVLYDYHCNDNYFQTSLRILEEKVDPTCPWCFSECDVDILTDGSFHCPKCMVCNTCENRLYMNPQTNIVQQCDCYNLDGERIDDMTSMHEEWNYHQEQYPSTFGIFQMEL